MATTTGLLSWEAFENLPDDGMHHELIEGELQSLPPPKSRHSIIAKRVFLALLNAEKAGNGQAFCEAGYRLGQDPGTWIQPDVSFVGNAQFLTRPEDDYFLGAPELAIEVVSPSETARSLQRKINLLLASGCRAIVVIYPDERELIVHRPGESPRSLRPGAALTLPDLLPDWQLPVAKIFED